MDNNFDLTKEEAQYVDELLKQMQSGCKKELSAKDNMINFYLSSFPDAQKSEAEDVVNRINHAVVTFTQNLEEANKNGEEWITAKINEVTEGLPVEEKYQMLYNFLLALHAVDARVVEENLTREGFNPQERFNEIAASGYQTNKEAVTSDEMDELEKQLKEALTTSSIIIAGNSEIADILEHLDEGTELISEFAENNWSDAEFKNYASLVSYIAYRQGKIPSMPANLEPEAIAVGVTAGIEQNKVISDAAAGKTSWDKAVHILKIIGFVALATLLVVLSAKFVCYAILIGGSIFETIFAGSLFGFLLGMVLGGILGFKGLFAFWKHSDKIFEFFGAGFDKAITLIAAGYRKAEALVKENIWPALLNGIKKFLKFIDVKVMQGVIRPFVDSATVATVVNPS